MEAMPFLPGPPKARTRRKRLRRRMGFPPTTNEPLFPSGLTIQSKRSASERLPMYCVGIVKLTRTKKAQDEQALHAVCRESFAVVWKAAHLLVRGLDHHSLGSVGPDVPILRYVATRDQHGHDHHHVPDGVPHPEHAKSRWRCHPDE